MKYTVITFPILLLFVSNLIAQVSIQSPIATNDLVCPGVRTEYSISLPSGSILCSVQWQISKGFGSFYLNESDVNPAEVIWDDQKPNKVEVEAIVSYRSSSGSCTSATSETVKFTHTLRSVFQETIPNVGSSVNVPYCSGAVPTITLSAGPMYIKNTGGIGQPPQTEVEIYNWMIPNGWQQKQTGDTGEVFTEVGILQIEPTNSGGECSSSAEVEVRAIAGGAYNCQGAAITESLTSTINITRTPNPSTLSVSPPAGFTGATCGSDAVTFTATEISCGLSYAL